MKAKAPEKIYLQQNTTTDCYEELWPEWFEARAKESDIEYTRTDAFIEKAATWIEAHTSLSEKLVIEDFKKYMKG